MNSLLAVGSGVLLALAFPKVDWHVLAWMAFVPLLWLVRDQGPRRAFTLGWLSGVGFYLCTLYWVIDTIGLYSNIPHVVAVGPLLLLCAVLAAYTGVFAAGASLAADRGTTLLILGPALWVGLEWVRSFFLIGFPWVGLGYSQYGFLNLIQFAEFTGVYGVSALVMLGNCILFVVLSRSGPGRGRLLVLLLVLLASLAGWGSWRRGQLAGMPPEYTLHVGIAQGNVAQDRKWDPDHQETTIARYEQLTRRLAEDGVDLVVWPEAAVPFFFQSDVTYRGRLLDLSQETKTPILFGSPAFWPRGGGVTLFNRTYLLSPQATVVDSYDKMILTPFGEYVPFQDGLFFFVQKMVDGIGDFAPGSRPTVFTLPFGTFSVLVCYEGVFPELARDFVRRGAALLVNVTNDAWFGETSAPYQHLVMEAMRTVENRVPLVRAANTGISAIVGIDGDITARTELSETTHLAGRLAWPRVTTVYTRYGDWFVFACLGSLPLVLGFVYVTSRRTRSAAESGTRFDARRRRP